MYVFRRCLQTESFRQLMDTAMDELYAYMNQDRIESMLAHYRGVTEEYVWRMPDRLYVPITHEQYEEVLESIWPEIDEDYDYYWESYHNPMPFYIGTPSLQNGVLQLSWDTSYDFNAEDISYTVELARDYQFRQMVYREEHVVLPMTQTAAPAAGQYFIRCGPPTPPATPRTPLIIMSSTAARCMVSSASTSSRTVPWWRIPMKNDAALWQRGMEWGKELLAPAAPQPCRGLPPRAEVPHLLRRQGRAGRADGPGAPPGPSREAGRVLHPQPLL